jgi:HK97 family phage major capsid protein
MKLSLAEFEANLALAKTLPTEQRQKYLLNLKSAQVFELDADGKEVNVKVTVMETEAAETKSAAPDEKKIAEIVAAELAKGRVTTPAVTGTPNDDKVAGQTKANPDIVPAEAKKWSGQLKAFKGEKAEENAYKTGVFLLALLGNDSAKQFCQNHGMIQKVASEGVNTNLGFLVFPEFESTIISLKEQYGVFRRNCRVLPMKSDTLAIPRRTSGFSAYWVAENAVPTESNMAVDQVNLVAKELAIIARASRQLIEDSIITVADLFAEEMAWKLSFSEDDAGFNGTGISTYGGIVGVRTAFTNLGGTISSIAGLKVSTGTGYASSYGSIVLADILGMMSKLPLYAQLDPSAAKFYCSQAFYEGTLMRIATAVGGTRGSEIVEGLRRYTLFGHEVVIAQVMPSAPATSQVCLLYGNLGMAAKMGDRRSMSLEVSNQASVGGQSTFERRQVAFLATERIDIVVHDIGNYTATLADQVQGPIVGLITASS